jgi:hypothetical protein
MRPLRVFIGYDEREAIAYHVLVASILRHASAPVAITPLVRSQLAAIHTRPRGPMESTDFSITRFLCPYLSGYEGVAVYMDCDMLALADIHELLEHMRGPVDTAVWVAKHDYIPRSETKFLGQSQTAYPRKNWSSLILFDNLECRALTPDYVNTSPALDLHRFAWLKDGQIGELPLEWNWLVGEYARNDGAKNYHYTLGGPWFDGYRACDHAEEWFRERNSMLGAA